MAATAVFNVPASASYLTPVEFDASLSAGTSHVWSIEGPNGYRDRGVGKRLLRSFPRAGTYQVTLTVTGGETSASATKTYEAKHALIRTDQGPSFRVAPTSQTDVDAIAPGWTRHDRHYMRADARPAAPFEGEVFAIGEMPAAFIARLKGWPKSGTAQGWVLPDGTKIMAGYVGTTWQERIIGPAGEILYARNPEIQVTRYYQLLEHTGTELHVTSQHGTPNAHVVVLPHNNTAGLLHVGDFALVDGATLGGSVADILTWTPGAIEVRGIPAGYAALAGEEGNVAPDAAGVATIQRQARDPWTPTVSVWDSAGVRRAMLVRPVPELIADKRMPFAPELTVLAVAPTYADMIVGPYRDQDGDWHYGGTRWQVALADDIMFASPVFDSHWTTMARDFIRAQPLPANTALIARGAFLDSAGNSAWGAPVAFATPSANRAPYQPTVTVNILSPTEIFAVGSEFEDPDAGDQHDRTWWRISHDEAGHQTVFDSLLQSEQLTTLYRSDLVAGETYWIHALYEDEHGAASLWSVPVPFTMPVPNRPPAKPAFVVHDIRTTTARLVLGGYYDPDGDAHAETEWRVRLAGDPAVVAFGRGFESDCLIERLVDGLPADTELLADARVKDARGGVSEWSDPVAFRTEARLRPGAPVLELASTSSTSLTVNATWRDVAGGTHDATQFQLTSPNDPTFAVPSRDSGWRSDDVEKLSITYTALASISTYLVRARTRRREDGAISDWCAPFAVSTPSSGAAPDRPRITSVEDITETSMFVVVSAYSHPGGTAQAGSHVQIARAGDPGFSAPVFDSLITSGTLRTRRVLSLVAGTDYLLRWRDRDSTNRVSAWSDTWAASTIIARSPWDAFYGKTIALDGGDLERIVMDEARRVAEWGDYGLKAPPVLFVGSQRPWHNAATNEVESDGIDDTGSLNASSYLTATNPYDGTTWVLIVVRNPLSSRVQEIFRMGSAAAPHLTLHRTPTGFQARADDGIIRTASVTADVGSDLYAIEIWRNTQYVNVRVIGLTNNSSASSGTLASFSRSSNPLVLGGAGTLAPESRVRGLVVLNRRPAAAELDRCMELLRTYWGVM